MAISKVTSGGIADGTLSVEDIADDAVTAAKLANSINTDIATGVTGNTTANAALPKAGGAMTGTITGFTSTGIDDNATSTAITINSSEQVGIGVTNAAVQLDIAEATRTGTHPAGIKGLYVTGDFGEVASGAEFRHTNATQGVGIGYAGIYKVDASADSNLLLKPKGTGNVEVKTGNLVIGTSGKGIDFSANGNAGGMTSEVLDDYEEGTWTPTLTGYSGGSTQAYSSQSGKYTKIGNMVYAHFYVALSSKGNISGNYVFLEGFPFNHDSANGGDVIIGGFSGQANNTYWVGGDMTSTVTAAWMSRGVAATGTHMMSAADLTNTSTFHGTCVYRV